MKYNMNNQLQMLQVFQEINKDVIYRITIKNDLRQIKFKLQIFYK